MALRGGEGPDILVNVHVALSDFASDHYHRSVDFVITLSSANSLVPGNFIHLLFVLVLALEQLQL